MLKFNSTIKAVHQIWSIPLHNAMSEIITNYMRRRQHILCNVKYIQILKIFFASKKTKN